MDGNNYDYEIWFTSAPSVPTSPIVAANQYSAIPTYYPLPVITHDVDNDHLLVAYHDNAGIKWVRSTNGGSSWGSPSTVSGTSGKRNPSMLSSDDETYLTYDNLSTVYSRQYTGSGWTSEEDATEGSGLSAERYSSVAVSEKGTMFKTFTWHVVWQAWDPSESQNVIAYRSRSSGEWKNDVITIFDPSISNYHYYYPVVAGGTHSSSDVALVAWKVGAAGNYRYQKIVNDQLQGSYQSESGWYPSVTTYLSAVHSSFTNPLIVAADGNQAPYEVEVNSSVSLPKATPTPMIYNRRIIAEYKNTDSSVVFVQLGEIKAQTENGQEITIDLFPIKDSEVKLTAENLSSYLNTQTVQMPEDVETLSFTYTVYTRASDKVKQDKAINLSFGVNLQDVQSNVNLAELVNIPVNETGDQFVLSNQKVSLNVKSFTGKQVRLYVDLQGLDLSRDDVVLGLAHVYKDADEADFDATKLVYPALLAPTDYVLHQNYPNPFNPETSIPYDLPKESQVLIEVYNVLGQKVSTLVDEQKQAGEYITHWNGLELTGKKATAGIYLCLMQAGDFVKTQKMTLLP